MTGLNPGDGTTLMWAVDLASGNYDQVQLSAGEPALTAAVALGGGDAEHERLYVAITSPGGSILAVDVTADGQATVAHVLGLSFSVQNYAPFCVSPNGRFIYAGVSGGIVSYDTADSFAQASVCGGSAIEALAVSPDGTRLYVLGDGCGSLTVVDLVGRQVLSSLSTGGGRTGDYPRLAAHPDGKHVFATGVKTAALTTIRLADNSVQSVPVTGVSNLCDVQISPDGRLVCVACSDAGTAAVIDPVANVVKEVWDDTSRSSLDAFDQTNAVGFKPDGETIGILRSQAGGGRLSLVQYAWEPLRQSR